MRCEPIRLMQNRISFLQKPTEPTPTTELKVVSEPQKDTFQKREDKEPEEKGA